MTTYRKTHLRQGRVVNGHTMDTKPKKKKEYPFKIEHEGDLTQFGYRLNENDEGKRHEALNKAIKSGKFKEMQLQGKLQALSLFNTRTNPQLSRRAASDRQFVARTMK